MAGSVNKVILIGNLGRDPELRTMQNGNKVATLNLATSETWKDRQTNERREKTEWHRVVIFGPTAEVAERYLRKGAKVYIEGQLQTRKWTDQSGQERFTTEVVVQGFGGTMTMLDGAQGGGNRPPPPDGPDAYGTHSGSSGANGAPSDPTGSGGYGNPPPELDDEIPF